MTRLTENADPMALTRLRPGLGAQIEAHREHGHILVTRDPDSKSASDPDVVFYDE